MPSEYDILLLLHLLRRPHAVYYHRSRRGGDRICPNVPDEGGARLQSRLARVRIGKSDSSRPKGGFAPIRG